MSHAVSSQAGGRFHGEHLWPSITNLPSARYLLQDCRQGCLDRSKVIFYILYYLFIYLFLFIIQSYTCGHLGRHGIFLPALCTLQNRGCLFEHQKLGISKSVSLHSCSVKKYKSSHASLLLEKRCIYQPCLCACLLVSLEARVPFLTLWVPTGECKMMYRQTLSTGCW